MLMSTPFYLSSMLLLLSGSLGVFCGKLLSKWLFVMIFMIFLGGMMILFFYIISLSKPKKMMFSMNTNYLIVFLLFFSLSLNFSSYSDKFLMSQIYSYMNFQLLLYLMFLLFLTLFSVVKISENFKGSLLMSW